MGSASRRLRAMFTQPGSVYAKPVIRRIVLSLAFFTLFIVVLATDFLGDRVSFETGQISDRDILAPRTVSYINTDKTKKLESEVLAGIVNVYDLDMAIVNKAGENLTALFRTAHTVKEDMQLSEQEKIAKVKGALPLLSATASTLLVTLDEAALERDQDRTLTLLNKYLQRGIRDDELDLAKKQIALEANELPLPLAEKQLITALAPLFLQTNFILNSKETEKRKQGVLAGIEPVRETIKKGQVLVRRGDVVTAEQIHALEELGLSRGQTNELRVLGLTFFVLIIMALTTLSLRTSAPSVYENDLSMVLVGLVMLITMILGKMAHYYSDFAAPMTVGALLATILINRRIGLAVTFALTIFFGVIVDHDLRAVLTCLMGSITGVYCISTVTTGYSLAKSGFWISIVQFLVIATTGLIDQISGAELVTQCLLGIFSGVTATIITTGILPYLENVFHITTSVKLMDLARPNHPLLQQLLLEAPGTYHHSVLIGNMVETAAAQIGADPVLARVGAYYHDIGKIKRPCFFVENQASGENPHDKIAPSLSTLIITSHIKDGRDLCREHNIPGIVADIVQQHHGTTLVSYFYQRATENDHSECIIESDFRYEGPCPQSKEAALVMLADGCEAAVRSIAKPNINRIEATVRKIIKQRLHEGQLDECNLTLRDLNTIGDIFIRVLSSMFHTRIEYPDEKDLERRKLKNGNQHKLLTDRSDCIGRDGGDSQESFKQSS
ncbi:MAG: HDIG domain-containing protein [Sporomusaceae bacterium]|nr:HDIG domain-containing protein [Sporomusaceae bacterium]